MHSAPALILGTVPPAASWSPALAAAALLVAGAALIVAAVALLRGRPRETRSSDLSGRERLDLLRREAEQRDAMKAMLRDAEELARRLEERLDAKAEHLERLLREAESGPTARATPIRTVTMPAPQPAQPPEAGVDPLVPEVTRLADAGLSPLDIARAVRQPVGKVELILALRRGPAAPPRA